MSGNQHSEMNARRDSQNNSGYRIDPPEKLLADAIGERDRIIAAGSVYFHGTHMGDPGVQLDPDKLTGDKWFTPDISIARGHAGNLTRTNQDSSLK
jgi:hypothetical protein